MWVYLALLTITIISLILFSKTKKVFFKILPYIMMSFVGGFRSEVGVDYLSYKEQFYEIILKKNWYENWEIGYRTLVEVIHHLGGSYQMMFLIMSISTCYFYYRFISENSEDYIMSTMLYMCLGPFYLSSYNTLREAFAISIFLYSLKFIDKNIKKYFLMILFAATFHRSAIIFFAFPLIKKIKKWYIFYVIIFSLAGVLSIQTGFLNWMLSTFAYIYSGYSVTRINMDMSYMVYYLICITIIIINSKMKLGINKTYMYMLTFTCILIFVGLATGKFVIMLTRFASWGTPALIIVLPEIAKRVKQKSVFNSLIYVFCIAYFFMVISNGRTMLPYNFNFNLFDITRQYFV